MEHLALCEQSSYQYPDRNGVGMLWDWAPQEDELGGKEPWALVEVPAALGALQCPAEGQGSTDTKKGGTAGTNWFSGGCHCTARGRDNTQHSLLERHRCHRSQEL